MEAVSSTAYFSSQPQLPASTAGDPATPIASASRLARQPRRNSSFVTVEASSGTGGDGVVRTRSLTEDDLEELKGCLDLGFGFAYSEIPELCGTLPALELCYSMTRRFLDEQREPGQEQETSATPLPNWRISGPGDDPEEVKARLKYWAQAVACTVKLCS
ncbi:hypothetical protein SEVIR_5G420500v4 [Setaria viridis]|uniref:Uncharacterized protein n=1 Tax=Setaria viridis TaxID=4556 RepID=A0A4U6USX7_SETVI|nr:uncharacterized protein LOC117857418 [Setaria viridis]TKW18264.1 hypothetical protein SEVIR_5G420500v2 [Setaria viridis]